MAAAASGGFVVVWTSEMSPFDTDIRGQRYAGDGTPLGPEFRVNTATTSFQLYPSIAADSSGNFVVVWSSLNPHGVFGQRYASSGSPLGPEFRVNTYMTSFQFHPSVATDSSGNFVVVWQSSEDGSAVGVLGQRYASSGSPLGPEFRVNTYTTGAQRGPDIAADSLGNFVVAWTSADQDGSGYGVFAQRYASSGMPVGPEFRVNTFTAASQGYPSVAADSSGDFVVVWHSLLQDGSNYGVYGQRYGQIVPVELMGFRVE